MIRIGGHRDKRRRMALTPLIDVIFILVMFFLLSSTFGIWRPLDIGLAGRTAPETGGDGASAPSNAPGVYIAVKAAGAASRITVNGQPVPLENLAGELNRLAAKGATGAVLVPAPKADFQFVVQVLDAARQSRLKAVNLTLK